MFTASEMSTKTMSGSSDRKLIEKDGKATSYVWNFFAFYQSYILTINRPSVDADHADGRCGQLENGR